MTNHVYGKVSPSTLESAQRTCAEVREFLVLHCETNSDAADLLDNIEEAITDLENARHRIELELFT